MARHWGLFLSLAACKSCWAPESLSMCFLLGTSPRHHEYRRNSAGSFVGDARGGTVLYWVCCFGSTEKLEPCLFVAGCRVYFQNEERFSSPRFLVQSFEICPVASEGEGLASGEVNAGQTRALCKLFHWCSICMSKCCQNRLPTYPYMAPILVRAGNSSYFSGVHL